MRFVQKVSLAIFTLVVAVMFLVIAILSVSTTAWIKEEYRRDLALAKKIADQFLRARFESIVRFNDLLVEVPLVKAVVDTPGIDHASALDVAQTVRRALGTDLFMLCDREGKLLASTSEPERFGDNLLGRAEFQKALAGEKVETVLSDEKGVFLIAVSPIVTGGETVAGAVLVGFAVSKETLAPLEEVTKSEVVILNASGIIVVSPKAGFLQKFGEEVWRAGLGAGEASSVGAGKFGGKDYFFVTSPFVKEGIICFLARPLEQGLAFYRELQRKLLFGAFLVLAAALGISFLYIRRMTRPLQSLMAGARRIAVGDFSSRVTATSNDEIAELAATFNYMSDNLIRLVEKEKRLAAVTAAAEAERKRAAELDAANQELKRTQAMLIQSEKMESIGRLAAGVAHEVKNPLAIIQLSTDYLLNALANEEAVKEVSGVLHDMQEAVVRANTIIRALLDFSVLNKLELELEDLNLVIKQSLLLVRHELDKSQISLQELLAPSLPKVELNRLQIQQVFINVFMNAVQAMKKGGTLTIRTYVKRLSDQSEIIGRRNTTFFSAGEDVVIAEVEDTGEGIPESEARRLFDPFFTTKAPGEGAGLGLSVVDKIIELHKATIDITNSKEGGAEVAMMFHASKPC